MSDSENIDRIWQWQTWQDFSYLTCNLLSAWQHGFFTQDFYPRLPQDLTSVWQSGINAYRVKQVHGNLVLTTQEIARAIREQKLTNAFPDADAILSEQPQQSVWAASADCTPILIGDVVTGQVCSIHAGWRGTAKKIVVQAIARFLDFGSKKQNLRIAIGPAISGKVYQVDEYVAVEVGRTIVTDAEGKTDAEILTRLKQFPNSPLLPDNLPGKARLDVPKVNFIQLKQLDINPKQIAIAPYCTYQHSDCFFSYRRTGKKNVQWSGIVSKC